LILTPTVELSITAMIIPLSLRLAQL
jgi:hypothetical protein